MRSANLTNGRQPRAFVEEARRAQLIECAAAAIDELGLPKTSLSEIAARAGVSKPTVIYYFGSRDELIDAVLTTILAAGAQFLSERTATAGTPAGELEAYIDANVDYIRTHRRDVAVVTTIAMNHTDDEGRSRLRHDASAYGTGLAPLRDILDRGQHIGEFRALDTRTTAMTIRAAIDAIGPQLRAIPDLDLAAYRDGLIDLFRHATRAISTTPATTRAAEETASTPTRPRSEHR